MPFTDFSDPAFQLFPRRFGAYTLLRPLSRGGMGEVFLARTGALIGAERLCVLKTVRGDLANDDDYVRRFVEEARVAVTLTHSGVCHVFDAGRVGARLYLAMEHIAGMTVRELTDVLQQKQRQLTTAYVLHIVIELLEALDYAHNYRHPESGQRISVVHRDVSPQNVMVSFEGDVKLIDFGLSKAASVADGTSDDMVMGKLFYMSPEQARGDAVDGRTDQFAAAIVAYELFTGQRFYGVRERDDVTSFVGVGGFVPDAIGEVPPEVQRVLLRAWSAVADDRYPTCGEMAAELRRILAVNHPMMSRSTLKSFLANTLAEEQDAYRAQIRELPAASTTAAAPVEQTQSFMLAPGTSSSTALSTSTAAHTERVTVLRHPGDTDETAHVAELTARRTPRLALAGAALALVVAAIGVRMMMAPAAPVVDVTAASPVAPVAPVAAPVAAVPAVDVPVAAAPDPVAPVAPMDAAVVAPDPAVAPAVDEPVRGTRKGDARGSRRAKAHAPVTAPATPATPAKLPGTIASKREIVSRCDVCKGIKNQIRDGKDVPEEVLDNCIRKCRAQGQQ